MIVEWNDLPDLAYEVAMVDGSFDPLHEGHITYFNKAAALRLPVLCNIAPETVTSIKHPVLLESDLRSKVLDALRPITYVHVSSRPTAEVLEQLKPRFYVKGPDWRDRLPSEELSACRESGTEIVFTDGPVNSSSRLISGLPTKPPSLAELDSFEAFLQGQVAIQGEAFDNHYFADPWRHQQNTYTLDSRREIEGKHPELVKKVFDPTRVLDAGCGPGMLMQLLAEQGLDVAGVDASPAVHEMADPITAKSISVADISLMPFADGEFDLVICREVLEHLPLRRYVSSISELCRVSSKYVYVTTRFHPKPFTMFDVTTEFEVDPTHITLAPQPLVRLMFSLLGLKRRPDLEAEIDWMNKGRVLIYEKVEASRGV